MDWVVVATSGFFLFILWLSRQYPCFELGVVCRTLSHTRKSKVSAEYLL